MSQKIPPKIVDKLCRRILEQLKDHSLLTFKAGEEKVLARMIKAFQDDLDKENALDAEVRKLMDRYRSAIDRGEVDEHKMFQMIRKQLIKDKKLVI